MVQLILVQPVLVRRLLWIRIYRWRRNAQISWHPFVKGCRNVFRRQFPRRCRPCGQQYCQDHHGRIFSRRRCRFIAHEDRLTPDFLQQQGLFGDSLRCTCTQGLLQCILFGSRSFQILCVLVQGLSIRLRIFHTGHFIQLDIPPLFFQRLQLGFQFSQGFVRQLFAFT